MAGSPSSSSPTAGVRTPAEIDRSCRLPLLVLFGSAAIWLVIASVFGLMASLKFHSAQFLADCPWLTYGRVRPAFTNSILYGFCVPAGLGVALWLIARLGRTALAHPWLVTVGAKFWNLGVMAGVVGILAGDSTGFEHLELPPYAALLCFLGYLLIGLFGILTFHRRSDRSLFPSQWFLFAALFWFPWIFSTANLLLVAFPVRGMAQAVVAWWYSQNLLTVWLGLVGVGAAFYFVSRLSNRDLHSRYLALFAFWMLVLFASWGGIPNVAAVPAWMPVTSAVATVLTVIPIIAVALNVFQTLPAGNTVPGTATGQGPGASGPSLAFILFGVGAFVVAGLMNVARALLDCAQTLHFTWFAPAQAGLQYYGFFAMVMFGAIYYLLPKLTGLELPWPKLARLHFWAAALGILAVTIPLAVGGILQSVQLQHAAISPVQMARSSLVFLRLSTVGELALLLGHLVFLGNIAGLLVRLYRTRVVPVYEAATANLFESAEAGS